METQTAHTPKDTSRQASFPLTHRIPIFPATYFKTPNGFMTAVMMHDIKLADGSNAQLMQLEPCQPPVSNEFVAVGCGLFEESSNRSPKNEFQWSDKDVARFHVCKFPSYLGTPWKFRSRLLAIIAGYIRSVFGFRMCEVRLIDTETGDHLKVW